MISGIINVEVSVIGRAEGRGYRDIDYLGYAQKPNLIIALLYVVLKKTATNTLSQEN